MDILWLSFAKNKHIFEYLIISDTIWKCRRIFLINHRIMQIKSESFEIKRLHETGSAFATFDSFITNNPNAYPSQLHNPKYFFCDWSKFKIKSFVISQSIVRWTCQH